LINRRPATAVAWQRTPTAVGSGARPIKLCPLILHYGTLLNLEKPALISAERRLLASKTVPWTAFWPPVSSWLGAIQPVTTGINKVPTRRIVG